jgi:hypothetical protein
MKAVWRWRQPDGCDFASEQAWQGRLMRDQRRKT